MHAAFEGRAKGVNHARNHSRYRRAPDREVQQHPDGSKTVSSTDGRILGKTNAWGTFASDGRRLGPQRVTGLLFGRNLEDGD